MRHDGHRGRPGTPTWQFPELIAAVAFTLLQLNLAASVALSGGAFSPLLPLMVVPVFSQAVCFRKPVIRAAVGLSAILAVSSVLLADSKDEAPAALHLLSYLALLACLAIAAFYLAASDRNARDETVLDALTGLLNRKALRQRFHDAREQAERLAGFVSVVLCDVDHFETVNDTYGHERGDLVLREIADRLRTGCPANDLVYRLGGEEFLVLLPGFDAGSATRLAEQLRQAVAGAATAGLPVTISAGVATTSGASLGLSDLLALADAALYRAKAAGRNRVEVAEVAQLSENPGAAAVGGAERCQREGKRARSATVGRLIGPLALPVDRPMCRGTSGGELSTHCRGFTTIRTGLPSLVSSRFTPSAMSSSGMTALTDFETSSRPVETSRTSSSRCGFW